MLKIVIKRLKTTPRQVPHMPLDARIVQLLFRLTMPWALPALHPHPPCMLYVAHAAEQWPDVVHQASSAIGATSGI